MCYILEVNLSFYHFNSEKMHKKHYNEIRIGPKKVRARTMITMIKSRATVMRPTKLKLSKINHKNTKPSQPCLQEVVRKVDVRYRLSGRHCR